MLGKHKFIVNYASAMIARELGNALIAPVVTYVPEGDVNNPTRGHLSKAGTITFPEEFYIKLLEYAARSLAVHGFNDIVMIGDSGGNQTGMQNAANLLNAEWGTKKVLFIPEFYDNAGVQQHMENTFGIFEESEGWHDNYWLSAMQAAVDPETVRYEERVQSGRASINGVSLVPLGRTIAVGEELMGWRTEQTVAAILASMQK